MTIKQKIGSAAATAAFMGALFAPIAHGATVTITGNGGGSVNQVTSTNKNIVKVKQKSVTVANTMVGSSATTGGNNANGNVGGTTSMMSGIATSTVTVGVAGGSNTGTVPSCGCNIPDMTVTITGNGGGSVNQVTSSNTNVTKVSQKSVTVANTMVESSADTGGNNANGNVGGTTTVTSGIATSTVSVGVQGGSNSL